ncbi:MAG TPA: hypothetical protein VET87_01105 [Rubrivivax sp.]|nr:hypothetical protein [Rubrivivax sp.]
MSTGPKLHHVMAKGLPLACFERRLAQRGVAPTLWLVHATGFDSRP